NTVIALSIAFIMRFIPLGFGAIGPSILRISPELERAARVSGATRLRPVVEAGLGVRVRLAVHQLLERVFERDLPVRARLGSDRNDDDRALAAGELRPGGGPGDEPVAHHVRGAGGEPAPVWSTAAWLRSQESEVRSQEL